MNSAVTGVHHITLRVTDLPRSRDFYERVLGLEVDQAFDDKCRLRFGPSVHASRLVLRPLLPDSSKEPFNERRVGLDHIAIRVSGRDELERLAAELQAAGVATQGVQAVAGGGALVCFRDPDNVQLEFFVDA